jgi:tetratricopeptide (TPR) repeat protein
MRLFFRQISFVVTFILAGVCCSFAQTRLVKLGHLLTVNDTTGALQLLQHWEQEAPKDPEMFIGYFNYYYQISQHEVLSIDEKAGGEDALVVTDTGSNKEVGFLNINTSFAASALRKGFDYIHGGIALYPKRLDMRFGEIYVLGQIKDYETFTNVLMETIHYGNSIQNKWLWKEGKDLDQGTDFLLSSIQDYVLTLYNTNDDAQLPQMRRISEAVLKYYPNHVESLSDIALTFILTKEYDKAIPFLLHAEEISPKDAIVLNNLAEAYLRKGNVEQAKIYLNKVIAFGSADDKQEAREKLANIK